MSRNVKLLYLGSLDQICSCPSNFLSSESILPFRRCTMIPTVMMSTEQRNVVGSEEHMTSAEVSNALTSEGEWHKKHRSLLSETALNSLSSLSRKERRKSLKKLRRKQIRQEAAEKEILEQLARLEDPAERFRILEEEKLEAEQLEKERLEHEKQERLFQERERKAQEEFERKQEELLKKEQERKIQEDGEENWRYVEDDGPAEIIWEGNEIIVKKKRVKVPAELAELQPIKNADQSKSNPLPPQSTAFAAYKYPPPSTPDVGEQNPIFGTEQDKTHCPFHIKTGVCRFGTRCSRVHVYPDQSFTLLMRNMYTGPGLIWDQDEGLEHSEEEVAEQYEEFYEDVHSEFLQFGELVNFKVCKNGSSHLRGNVYVHYQTEAGAQAAYNAINGRFYAGKQITCEFVGVTRWRVALCGEYMKGHHMACSHGSACNFLHCFRNPRGEYDWADWDSPPPRYWVRKMAKLFGCERDYREDDDSYHDNARKRDRSSEKDRGHRSKHRYSDSRVDDYEHSSTHRERRRHRIRDRSYQSSSDDLGSSSRHERRCRHERSGPGSVGEQSRGRASGGFKKGRSYLRDSVDCVDISEDKAAPMGGDKLDNRDREWKYGRDHELDGHDDEIYRQIRRDRKRGILPQHERSSRVSTRSVSRDERIHGYRLSYVPKSKKGSPGDEILEQASETEDESERKSRKRDSGETERSNSRRGSKSYSKRSEGDSSGGETHRDPKTSKNGYKRRIHQDSVRMLSGEDDAFLQSEDRWRPDVDIYG